MFVSTEGHSLEAHDFGEVLDYEVVRPIRLLPVRRTRQTEVAELLLLPLLFLLLHSVLLLIFLLLLE